VTPHNSPDTLEAFLALLSDEALSYLEEGFALEWRAQALLFSEGSKSAEQLAQGHTRMALLLGIVERIKAVRVSA
jgi:ribose 1,5-bisphosphokinase PhnN